MLLKRTVWSGFSSQVLQVREAVSKLAVRFLFAEKLLTWKDMKLRPSLVSIREPVGERGVEEQVASDLQVKAASLAALTDL